MTAHRRVIEDRADEAEANLSEIEGARKDAELCMARLKRIAHLCPLDQAMLIDDAIYRIEQGIDHLVKAERYPVPDLDTNYPGRSAPGSH